MSHQQNKTAQKLHIHICCPDPLIVLLCVRLINNNEYTHDKRNVINPNRTHYLFKCLSLGGIFDGAFILRALSFVVALSILWYQCEIYQSMTRKLKNSRTESSLTDGEQSWNMGFRIPIFPRVLFLFDKWNWPFPFGIYQIHFGVFFYFMDASFGPLFNRFRWTSISWIGTIGFMTYGCSRSP